MFKLTPKDIIKQEFKKVMRGYDPVEVDTFLEMIAEEFESLLRYKNEHQDKPDVGESEIHRYNDKIAELENKLEELHEAVNEPAETTTDIHQSLIKYAEEKAANIIRKAEKESDKILDEIITLKKLKEKDLDKFKKLLRTEYQLIKIFEQNDTDLPEIQNLERRRRKGIVPEKPDSTFIASTGPKRRTDIETETESQPEPENEADEDARKTFDSPADNSSGHSLILDQSGREFAEETKDDPGQAEETIDDPEQTKESKKPERDSLIPGIQNGFNLIDNILDKEDSDSEDDSPEEDNHNASEENE